MRIQFLRKSGALEMIRKLFFGKKSGALVLTIRQVLACMTHVKYPGHHTGVKVFIWGGV